jgi:hypothetical protein
MKINLAHGPRAWSGNRISVREKDKQAGNENHEFSMPNESGRISGGRQMH